MDWDILNIFKKAEFNSLMLSIAAAGWILYYLGVFKEYSLIAALVASIYCLIRFVLCCYKNFVARIDAKNYEAQQKREKEHKEKAYEEKRRIEISRMFDGLSGSNKFVLASLLLKGNKDSYNYNVLHFPKYGNDSVNIYTAQEITMIYRTEYGGGQYTINIKEYTDTVSVTIDSILYNLIESYIQKEQSKNI